MGVFTYIDDNDQLTDSGYDWSGSIAPPPTRWFATDALTRYFPLFDISTNQIHVMKSTDAGATDLGWVAMDDTNAPISADDSGGAGSVPGALYQFFGTAFDSVNKIIYLVFWDTSSYNLAYKPFNCGTDTFGSQVTSSLPQQLAGGIFHCGFSCAFRPTDGALMVLGSIGGDGTDGGNTSKCWYAKVVSGVWDSSWTEVPPGNANNITNSADGTTWGEELFPSGIGIDPGTGDAHFLLIGRRPYTLGEAVVRLYANTGLAPGVLGPLISVGGFPGGVGFPNGTWNNNVVTGAGGVGHGSAHITFTTSGGAAVSAAVISTDSNWSQNDEIRISALETVDYRLLHVVLRADDTFSTPQVIVNNPGTLEGESYSVNGYEITNVGAFDVFGGTMRATYRDDASDTGGALNSTAHVLRALVGYAPTWEDTTPLTGYDSHVGGVCMVDCLGFDGTVNFSIAVQGGADHAFSNGGELYVEGPTVAADYLFFGWDAGGGTRRYSYLTSTGIGSGWSTDTTIADYSQSSPQTSFLGLAAMRTGAAPPAPKKRKFFPRYWKSSTRRAA